MARKKQARRLVSQADAAVIYDCKRPSISEAARPGGALADAVVQSGSKKYINLWHPSALAYRYEHQTEDLAAQARENGVHLDTPQKSVADLDPDLARYWDWTLEQIVAEFVTLPAFAALLQAADKIEGIRAKRLAADRSTGELISRAFVRVHVVGLVERISQRMLTEMPTRLSYELFGAFEREEKPTAEAIQTMIQEAVGRELKHAKRDTKKAIKRATD